ncbi:MAG: hypothetical protein UW09_C0003G0226 [candidate division TM6 bacterium GW2011_GWF2_43_87]|nr:MAG: hypothetical protein UW09_C0003G0226 [candidate division TM6 bacterium GW2011_GWF2_43_87]
MGICIWTFFRSVFSPLNSALGNARIKTLGNWSIVSTQECLVSFLQMGQFLLIIVFGLFSPSSRLFSFVSSCKCVSLIRGRIDFFPQMLHVCVYLILNRNGGKDGGKNGGLVFLSVSRRWNMASVASC